MAARRAFKTYKFLEAGFRFDTSVQGIRAQKTADKRDGRPLGDGLVNNSLVDCKEDRKTRDEES